MKISQSFKIIKTTTSSIEKKDKHKNFFYRYLDYQRIQWFFNDLGFSIIESSLHWNMLLLHLYENSENNNYIACMKIQVDKENAIIEFDFTPKIIHKDSKFESILFSFFQVYISSRIELNNNEAMIHPYSHPLLEEQKQDFYNEFYYTYKWNDLYIDLMNYKVVGSEKCINLHDVENIEEIKKFDKTGLLNIKLNYMKKKERISSFDLLEL